MPWPEPHYFVITTHGGTGSTWLARVLNSNAALACTHYIYGLTNPRQVLKPAKANTMLLPDYLKLLARQLYLPVVALGNINGFNYSEIRHSQKNLHNLTVINLVRHPINRVESMYRNWLRHRTTYVATRDDLSLAAKRYISNLSPIYADSLLDNKDWLFFEVLAQQDRALQDMQLAEQDGIEQIRFEDITNDHLQMINLVKKISGARLLLSKPEVQSMYQIPALNSHHPKSILAAAQYQSWQPWQRAAFCLHMQHDTTGIYQKFGYQSYCDD